MPAFAVSDDELIMVARREASQQERRCGLVDDAALNERVQRVFARIVKSSQATRWPLSIKILNDPQPNAFSLPNGQVYVHSGLFRLQPDDDELAFVLAHEIAHVCREHVKRTMDVAERSGGRVDRAWMSGASRANESEADLDGVTAMVSAGYHAQAVLNFMQKMGRTMDRNLRRPSAFDDHPRTPERIRNVLGLMSQHPEWGVTDAIAREAAGIGSDQPQMSSRQQAYRPQPYAGPEQFPGPQQFPGMNPYPQQYPGMSPYPQQMGPYPGQVIIMRPPPYGYPAPYGRPPGY